MKKWFSFKSIKAWFISAVTFLVLVIVVDVLAFGVFYKPIVMALGSERPVYGDDVDSPYVPEAQSKQEAYDLANSYNEWFCEEGSVLLKNANNALPLAEGSKVSVFGKSSVNLVYGGTGSSAGNLSNAKTLYDSLEAAGFEYNPTLKSFYDDDKKSGSGRGENSDDLDNGEEVMMSTGETPYSSYVSNNITASYAGYSDAAIVVFSRAGGEGFDLPKTSSDDPDRHYLELDPNEQELLRQVTNVFEKVVVVINSSHAMELGFVEDGTYGDIDACLWIGAPGASGIMSLGRILSGEVTPSGHTADTYAADFTKDPSYNNFGYTANVYDKKDSSDRSYWFSQYEEGIYVGYRYYETAWYEAEQGNYADFDYDSAVVYPFGYGLSYTSFSWEIVDDSSLNGKEISEDGSYTVTVKVTNTGRYPGKDVVQMYCGAPYTKGGIEKAYKVLCGFEKTPELYPSSENAAHSEDAADGKDKPNSCEITLTFTPYDVASYDYSDANENGFVGYELDSGNYTMFVSFDAHDDFAEIPFTVGADGIRYENDPDTDTKIENLFSDAEEGLVTERLSRSDFAGTWPQKATDADKTASDELISSLTSTKSNNPESDSYTMPEQGVVSETPLTLRDLLYDEDGKFVGRVSYDDPRWEQLLNQLTVSDLGNLFNDGCFHSVAVLGIGKPLTIDTDGPSGFTNFIQKDLVTKTCVYCSEVVLSSSWNKEVLYQMGSSIGDEGIWGNMESGGYPYSGLYAPGANIHRSPFGGRNGEYFSEDSYLTGICAAKEIEGAADKGVYMTIKHFAVNEQETKRSVSGLVNWLDEQSLRELYLKAFEIAIKESDGKASAVMSSFTRIGTVWAGGDYRLLTTVLRDEWGFNGFVISDFNTNYYMNCKQMAYAGGDLNLSSTRFWNGAENASSAADVTVLRKAAKNILYTVVNSNAMNGNIIGYKMPIWQVIAITVESILGGIAVGTGIFVFVRAARKRKAGSPDDTSADGADSSEQG